MIRDSIESLNSEGDDESQLGAKMDANSLKNGNGSAESLGHRGNKGHEEMEMEESKKKKRPACSNCINKNLLGLKVLLFLFYGGLGMLATWLNHSLLSKRFSESETALVYGLASLLSIAAPFIFGLISDKSAQPKKVLAVSLLLAGLLYPLILVVPSAVSYHYKEKHNWCRETGRNESSCLPYTLNCTSSGAELITNYAVCSQGCGGKLILTKCHYHCNDKEVVNSAASAAMKTESTTPGGEVDNYEVESYGDGPVAAAQIYPDEDYEEYDYDEDVDFEDGPAPHVCLNSNWKNYSSSICKVYDKKMNEIVVSVSGISGHTGANGDEMCHYPLNDVEEGDETPKPLIFCPPISGSSNCYVTCVPKWDLNEVDQWVCGDDYREWIIAFLIFLAVHTLGTMLLISAAGLLNSAVVSMVHEHEHGEYLGFQLIYGAFGFAILTPLFAFLFQYFQSHEWESLPWNLEYLLGISLWLLVSSIIASYLPYNAEWVPKTGTIRPMLTKWCLRGQNLLFFETIITLGCFQGMLDVMSYYQIKSTGGTLFTIGIGAAASVLPAIIFLFRVERVIDYCGYYNILYIALAVISLQFTGYAYLKDVTPEWSFLIKGMDTFSIVMVWITASVATHNLAPRSLVATCQTIVVIFYCCIGRGIGGVLCYFGLKFMNKECLLKTCGALSILCCIIFLTIHYWCLKPVSYTKKRKLEKPTSQGTTGNYKPLKPIATHEKRDDGDEM